jgi:hypothetical protein
VKGHKATSDDHRVVLDEHGVFNRVRVTLPAAKN